MFDALQLRKRKQTDLLVTAKWSHCWFNVRLDQCFLISNALLPLACHKQSWIAKSSFLILLCYITKFGQSAFYDVTKGSDAAFRLVATLPVCRQRLRLKPLNFKLQPITKIPQSKLSGLTACCKQRVKMCCFQDGWMEKHIRSRLPSERWGFSLNKEKKKTTRPSLVRKIQFRAQKYMNEMIQSKEKEWEKKDAVLRKASDLIHKMPLFSWVGWEIFCRQRNFPKLPNNNHMPQFNNWIFQFEGCFCSGQNFFFSKYIFFFLLQMKHTTVCKVISAGVFFSFSFFAILLFPEESEFSVQQDVSARSCMSTQVTSAAGKYITALTTDGVKAFSDEPQRGTTFHSSHTERTDITLGEQRKLYFRTSQFLKTINTWCKWRLWVKKKGWKSPGVQLLKVIIKTGSWLQRHHILPNSLPILSDKKGSPACHWTSQGESISYFAAWRRLKGHRILGLVHWSVTVSKHCFLHIVPAVGVLFQKNRQKSLRDSAISPAILLF